MPARRWPGTASDYGGSFSGGWCCVACSSTWRTLAVFARSASILVVLPAAMASIPVVRSRYPEQELPVPRFYQPRFAGFVVRVELKLLKFNDELCEQLLLSLRMPTPKSMAQQQTSILCRFCGGNRRGLPVYQMVCMPKEAQGCNCRSNAAAPCTFAPSLLCGFIRNCVALVKFPVLWKRMVLSFQLYLFGNVSEFIPVNSIAIY